MSGLASGVGLISGFPIADVVDQSYEPSVVTIILTGNPQVEVGYYIERVRARA